MPTTTTNAPSPALLTYQEAAERLGIPDSQVRTLAAIGKLRRVSLGYRTKRVTAASVSALKTKWEGGR